MEWDNQVEFLKKSYPNIEMPKDAARELVENFFRHESGQLIAVLGRFFGLQHIDLVEDMVQSALVDALRVWKTKGVPDQPAAWIHRVAKNRVLDSIRRDSTFRRKSHDLAVDIRLSDEQELDDLFEESQLSDNLLRLIFVCCHSSLPAESTIPLTLKTVCGFSEKEIARGLLLSPETVRKRIYRAKKTIASQNLTLDLPLDEQMSDRLQHVLNVLYLMFNEGYTSSLEDRAVRLDVCEEAARLCHQLTEHKQFRTKTTLALLALMLFHSSRFQSRVDQTGSLVLLEDQDRSLWDQKLLARATEIFHEASIDCRPTSYHFEAAIAMHHCNATRFEDTNWEGIVNLYDRLIAVRPSPIYELNRTVAIGYHVGPAAAILLLDQLKDDPRLKDFHLVDAVNGEMHRLSGDEERAMGFFQSAIEKTNSPHERQLLLRRIKQCQDQ